MSEKKLWKGVSPEWKEFLFRSKVRNSWLKAIKELKKQEKEIIPNKNLVLEPFRWFDPKKTKIILIGQDPFPKGATGLSFSSEKVSSSMLKVFKTLKHQGIIESIPKNGNLERWTKQGVLNINCLWTKSKEDKKLHLFWKDFTVSLLEEISYSDLFRKKIIVLVWGNKSNELLKKGNYGSKLKFLTWGHPSGFNRNNNEVSNPLNFIHCDHFQKVLREYPKFKW